MEVSAETIFHGNGRYEAEWVGKEVDPYTFGGVLDQAWKTGEVTRRANRIGYDMVMGRISHEDGWDQIKDLLSTLPDKVEDYGLPAQALRATVSMLPQLSEAIATGKGTGAAAGLSAAAAAVVAGTAIPSPLTVLPEEIITVPIATGLAYAVGTAYGSWNTFRKQMTGSMFLRLISQRMPPSDEDIAIVTDAMERQPAGTPAEVIAQDNPVVSEALKRIRYANAWRMDTGRARAAALAMGVAGSVMESFQVSKIPGLKRLIGSSIPRAMTNVVQSGAITNIARQAAVGLVTQSAVEGAQAVSERVILEASKEISKLEAFVTGAKEGRSLASEWNALVPEMLEASREALLAAPLFFLPGTAAQSIGALSRRRNLGFYDTIKIAEREATESKDQILENLLTARIPEKGQETEQSEYAYRIAKEIISEAEDPRRVESIIAEAVPLSEAMRDPDRDPNIGLSREAQEIIDDAPNEELVLQTPEFIRSVVEAHNEVARERVDPDALPEILEADIRDRMRRRAEENRATEGEVSPALLKVSEAVILVARERQATDLRGRQIARRQAQIAHGPDYDTEVQRQRDIDEDARYGQYNRRDDEQKVARAVLAASPDARTGLARAAQSVLANRPGSFDLLIRAARAVMDSSHKLNVPFNKETFSMQQATDALRSLTAAEETRAIGVHPKVWAAAHQLEREGTLSEDAYRAVLDAFDADQDKYRVVLARAKGVTNPSFYGSLGFTPEGIRITDTALPSPVSIGVMKEENERRRALSITRSSIGDKKVGEVLRESVESLIEKQVAKARAEEKDLVSRIRAKVEPVFDTAEAVESVRELVKEQVDVEKAKQQARDEHMATQKRISKIWKDFERIENRSKKFSKEHQEPVQEILSGIDRFRNGGQGTLNLEKSRDYFEQNPDAFNDLNPRDRRELASRFADLDKRDFNDLTIEELELLHQFVAQHAHFQKIKNTIRVEQEQRQLDEMVDMAVGEMEPASDIIRNVGKKPTGGIGSIRSKVWEFLNIKHLHYDILIDFLTTKTVGAKSIMNKVLYKAINAGRDVAKRYEESASAQFRNDLAESGFSVPPRRIKAWLDESTGQRIGQDEVAGKFTRKGVARRKVPFEGFELTRNERMSLYMHSLNADNRASIVEKGVGFKYRGKDNRHKVYRVSETTLDAIIDAMPEEEIRFASSLQNLFESQYELLNDVHRRLNGFDLVKEEFYYPKEVMSSARVDFEDSNNFDKTEGIDTRIHLVEGMLKTRLGVQAPIYLNPLSSDLFTSIHNSGAYIGLGEPMKMASKLLYNKKFRTELESRYGTITWKEIEKGLRDIAGDNLKNNDTEKIFMWFRGRITQAYFGLNPSIALKQILSGPLFNVYVKAQHLMDGAAEYSKNPRQISARHRHWSSEFTERRRVGFHREIAEIYMGSRGSGTGSAAEKSVYGGGKTPGQILTSPISITDNTTVSIGMEGAVRQVLHEFRNERLSVHVKTALDMENADIKSLTALQKVQKAYEFADWVVSRTQPMYSPEHRNSLQRGNVFEKSLTQFTSYTNQVLNLVHSTYRHGKRSGNFRPLAKTLFYAFAVSSGGATLIDELRLVTKRALQGKDNGSHPFVRRYLWGMVEGIPAMYAVVRDVISLGSRTLKYGPAGGGLGGTPASRGVEAMTDVAVDFVKAIDPNVSKETENRRKLKFFKTLAKTGTLITGGPNFVVDMLLAPIGRDQ